MGGMKLGKLEEFRGGRCKFMKKIHNLCLKIEEKWWRFEWERRYQGGETRGFRRVERENVRRRRKE